MFLLTLAIGAIPLFTELYPYYFIIRVCISLGLIISMNAPFLPDYVSEEHMGRANGWI